MISYDLRYFNFENFKILQGKRVEAGRILNGLIRKLENFKK